MSGCVKKLQIKLAMQESGKCISTQAAQISSIEYLQFLGKYSDWRYMAKMSRENPSELMSVLIHSGDYQVARDWAKLHQLPLDIVQVSNFELSYK